MKKLLILLLLLPTIAFGKVIVYTAPGCAECFKAERFLKKNNVPFTECDTAGNNRCMSTFLRNGWEGTPVIIVDGVVMVGYWKVPLTNLLKAKGYVK